MSFFFSHKNEEEISILLDIGSGYVEGALLNISKSKIPHIIFERRVAIPVGEKKNIERTTALMLKALGEVVEMLQKEGLLHLKFTKFGHQNIRNVYCVLSSPWYISQTKVIKIEKSKPFMVTSLLIKKLLEDENIAFKNSINQGEYSKDFKDTVSILESKIISTKLNGYETERPLRKFTTNIEVAIYLSIAGVDVTEKIKETIRKTFNFRTLRFHSFPLVFFSGIRDLRDTPNNFILVDIREEVTDVILIKKGLLLETVTVPLGTYFFTRELGKALNTLPQVALSFLRLYTLGKTEKEVTEKIKVFLNENKEWILRLHKALQSFREEFFLPKTLYLSTDNDLMPLFVSILEKEVFPQFFGDQNPFKVIPVDSTLLKGLYKADKSVGSTPFLPIESVFLKKILSE